MRRFPVEAVSFSLSPPQLAQEDVNNYDDSFVDLVPLIYSH